MLVDGIGFGGIVGIVVVVGMEVGKAVVGTVAVLMLEGIEGVVAVAIRE